MARIDGQPGDDPDHDGDDTLSAPFRSYALERADAPRFHIRLVEKTQRLYPAHKHDYFQIVYFMSEGPTARVGLKSYKPQPGSVYFIAPMTPHQMRFSSASRSVVIYFDLDFLRPGITRSYPIQELVRIAPELTPFAWQGHIDFNLDEAEAARVEEACREMILEHAEDRICTGEIIRAELTLMLGRICRAYEDRFDELSPVLPAIGRDSGHMRRISDFIAENYLRSPTLDQAAAYARLSRSRLCALLRQHTGTSFNALIREMRIDDARERLVLTDEPIGQIAYAVGYNDEKYFLRAFRKSVGMTPTAYRAKRLSDLAVPATTRRGLGAQAPGLMPRSRS